MSTSLGPIAADATAFDAVSAAPPTMPPEPPEPQTLRDTGLSAEFVSELLVKILYNLGASTGQVLTEAIRLPFTIIDNELLTLQQRRLVEVRSTVGHGRGGYLFDLTGAGRERAQEALASSQYAGPAPVPLELYREWVERQTIRDVHVTEERIREGFAGMVLAEQTLDLLGPGINSAKSLFLYGDAGNGKTMIAESIAGMLGGAIYVPFAVLVAGQIVIVHDPVYHRPAGEGAAADQASGDDVLAWLTRAGEEWDRRFAKVRRPS